ncbi:MAG: methyltransferase domain-containing protein [Candidatus Omnitrophica bacterium]|nr:methyltransferase domain-containing protein [Candidatus Omnitrophota bacterium]
MKPSTRDQLFKFWNTTQCYFELAREANLTLTPEREKALTYIPEGSLVLDVGCGSAEMGAHVSKSSKYIGIDISLLGIQMARTYQNNHFHVLVGDAAFLPFLEGSCDVVISTHSLEHFLPPQQVLDQMIHVLKPKGRLVLIADNFDCIFKQPPSLKYALKRPFGKARYLIRQLFKQVGLTLSSKATYFETISRPSVLIDGAYTADTDTVYVVSTREVIRYLRSQDLRIMYTAQRTRYDPMPGQDRWADRFIKNPLRRSRLFRAISKYWIDLFIVAEKP